jgi:hypothetical protein
MIFTPAEGTSFLLLDEQPAVFSAAAQKIYALNKTAALIWCGLEQGEPPSMVARRLVAYGVSAADATSYVNRASRRWLRIGLLQVDIKSFDDLAIISSFSVSLARSTWTIQVTSERIAQLLLQFFGNHNPPRQSGSMLKIIEAEDLVYVFDNSKCVLTCVMDDLVPSIKAYLTQLLVTQCAPDIAFHAACLEYNTKALLISGFPGAGKTTLALDLLQHGFEYCSDDIVLVRQDGTVTGVPFAPTIKSGAWRLLTQSYPGLNNMPVHRRPDGKRVRYLNSLAAAKNGSVYPVGVIVFLNRRSEGATKLVPLRRLDGLKRVIKGSFSPHGRMSQAALISCKSMVARADLFELSYANVTEASAAIMAVYNGKS